jgi:hypothetical protein
MCRVHWLKPVILAIWEAEIRRINFQGQPGRKLTRPPSQPMARCSGAHQLHEEAQLGELQSRPRHRVRPYLKNNHHKKG